MVRVVTIGFDGGNDGPRPDEAGQIIHVASGIVAGDSVCQPYELPDVEVRTKNVFDLPPVQAGVALLLLPQQTLLRSVNRAEPPGQVHAMDSYDLAVGKQLPQDVKRNPVVGVVEGRHEDEAVGDVEIGATAGGDKRSP